MTDKKWIDVAQLKEFFNVLSTQDLIELSMCSRLFRSKLIRVIYKTLKLSCSKMNNSGYKSYLITKEDSEYNDKDIQDRIEGFTQRYINRYFLIDHEGHDLRINFFTNPYKPLTEKFIATLTIALTWISLEEFQCLLDNLKYLEDLKFVGNYIFKCNLETVSSYINWPQTLTKLTFGYNNEVLLDNKVDPIPLDPYLDGLDIPTTQHSLLPTHLPNLKSLSLRPYNEGFDDKLEFLKVNSHITKLSLPFVEEIPRVFDIIQSFNNLEHLDILAKNYNYSKVIEFINSPIPLPLDLKTLTIDINYHEDIMPFLNKLFLQTTDLKLTFGVIYLNQLLTFISNLTASQLLKNLKLCFELISYEFYEVEGYCANKAFRTNVIKFPKLGSLESVEFKSLSESGNNAQMDLSNLNLNVGSCPKLKRIKFNSQNNLKYFGKIGSDKLGLGDNWKLISTPRRYLLHKASQ
ncbi:hypothetical protein CONCODRAFT_80784 [Conidiobolus coronatus NRRL 28638]|uniref:F-box domain-containing protein n=1 Tax=Conidiobolus coronatus (strain ATCC 28846 / CBS 209.66 / NRRL 28638) TaxID=796925 RepID=A0A137NRH3_CONC2|nr:hypothetical protein CONCODRAFT_80784 [Conidiobolus coronatus NRRL 28638]|eukprot:KXN65363.1 hypothetical protein CONCODRAFT_80784 [Conidiobolus coronatus NRRL 28638]